MQFKKRAMTEESNERWKNSMKKFKCWGIALNINGKP
jgi:hypothetical protein